MPRNVAPGPVNEDLPAPSMALECLAIIGRHYGRDLTVDQLRADNRLGPDKLGSEALTTRQVLACGRRAGFRCRTMFLKWDDIAEAEALCPAIVRFKDGSSMVLMGTRRDNGTPVVILQDPGAETPLVLDRVRFEQTWTGDLILVRPRLTAGGTGDHFGWPLILALVRRDHRLVRDLALNALGLSFLALAPLIFVRLLIERVLLYASANTLIVLGLVFGVLIGIETVFGSMRRFTLSRLTARVDAKLTTALYDKVLALPATYFETHPLGQTAYRMGQMKAVRDVFTGELSGAVLDAGILIFFLPVVFYLSPLMTLVVLAVAAIVVAGIVAALPRTRRAHALVAGAEQRRAAFLTQNLAGVRTVKSLALDAGQRERWAHLLRDVAGDRRKVMAVATMINAVVVPVDRMLLAGTLAVGVFVSTAAQHPAEVGALLAFYLLMQRLLAPLRHAALLVRQYEEARTAIAAVGELMNQPAEDGHAAAGLTNPIQGRIEFDAVTFTYRGGFVPALKAVSFTMPVGTTFGIMGRSGSGKTTITRLLQRLYPGVQGAIRMDGINLGDYDIAHLRRSIGVVSQDSFLFRGTIRENIIAAKHDATFEDMSAAARLAGAAEFIDQLPRGYETMIHEASPNLSVGQRQRLALARVLVTNPRVLILDEATSALDGDIDAVVSANMRLFARGRTTIIISHRLASLMTADVIMVLDDGEVRDIGRHHELLDRCELYSSQWHRQHAAVEGDAPPDALLALS